MQKNKEELQWKMYPITALLALLSTKFTWRNLIYFFEQPTKIIDVLVPDGRSNHRNFFLAL